MKREILRLENIVKKENNNEVLSGLYLNVFENETLGIICGNFHEKNGVIDLLSGGDYVSGRVYFDDKRIYPEQLRNNFDDQVSTISNKKTLISDLSVAENMFVVSKNYTKRLINKNDIYDKTELILKALNIDISSEQLVQNLSIVEYTFVEIAKAYANGCCIMILTDLSYFLSTIEIEQIYKKVSRLKNFGITFLIIEDHEDALFKFSDRLNVIHGGKSIRVLQNNNLSPQIISKLLIETIPEKELYPDREIKGNQILVFNNVYTQKLHDIEFTLHQGEIINLLCMDEVSYTEIVDLLRGNIKLTGGIIKLNNKDYTPYSCWDSVKSGICFISENPISNMLFYDMSVIDNLCFSMGIRIPSIWFKNRFRKNIAKKYSDKLKVDVFNERLEDLDTATLQKLIYSKWHLYNPHVIVCMKPFTTIGLPLRSITKELIYEYTNKGISVLLITSNITEAYYAGNRVIVMQNGRIVGEE